MMAKAEALKKSLPLAPGFEDKIRDVRYPVSEDRFLITFDSGREYSIDRSRFESDDGTDLLTVKVDRRRFFFQVTQASGNKYEIPWDRVLYEAEASYPYFRARPTRIGNGQTVGRKIREMRKAKRMTQVKLARATGMVRPNLSRIEAGRHRPTLATLERIAAALQVPVADLISK